MLHLIRSYISRHNEGVRTGDFHPMLELFHQEAEFWFCQMSFEGVNYGLYKGQDSIAKIFEVNPPDDKLEIISVTEDSFGVKATYGWHKNSGIVAGVMRVGVEDELITRFVVSIF